MSLQVNNSRIEEVSASPSVEREVVVPAIEGRVEVYIDRKGCVEVKTFFFELLFVDDAFHLICGKSHGFPGRFCRL